MLCVCEVLNLTVPQSSLSFSFLIVVILIPIFKISMSIEPDRKDLHNDEDGYELWEGKSNFKQSGNLHRRWHLIIAN